MSADESNFFDTNVLLYLLSADELKANIAERALESGGVINVQVLNEFVNVCRRKLNLDWADTRSALTVIRAVCVTRPLTESIHDRGTSIAEKYKLSVYDSMIVAAALDAGCKQQLSEDMHAGLQVEGQLTIINPFFGANNLIKY